MSDLTVDRQLEAWLGTQSREVCLAIAARAALRVFPALGNFADRSSRLGPQWSIPPFRARFSGEREHLEMLKVNALPIVRAMAITLAAAAYGSSNEAIRKVANNAYFAAHTSASYYEAKSFVTSSRVAAAAAFASRAIYADVVADSVAAEITAHGVAPTYSLETIRGGAFQAGDFQENAFDTGLPTDRTASADIVSIVEGGSASVLAKQRLWLDAMPQGARDLWMQLKNGLLRLDEGWDVWVRWYEAVLEGQPTPGGEELDIFRVTLPEELWVQEPKAVNAAIKAKEEEIAQRISLEGPIQGIFDDVIEEDTSTFDLSFVQGPVQEPPEIPNEVAGPAWDIDPASGLIAPVFRNSQQSNSEIDDMEKQRPFLLNCAQDLVSAISGSTSNSAKQLLPAAERYLRSIDKHSSTISIDEVYSAGVRLRNAHDRIRREVENEGMPDVSVSIGEAMDSVIGLHGPFVLSTARGAEHDRRARDHNRTKAQDLEYKTKSLEFADAINRSNDLVIQGGKDLLIEVNIDIATGSFPERSTIIAEASNQNLLVRLVRVATSETAKEIAKSSVIGTAIVANGTGLLNAATSWLLLNYPLLIALAATSPVGLGWLPHILDWLRATVELSKTK